MTKLAEEFTKFPGSLREFAKYKNLPRTTVQRWVLNATTKPPGREPSLSQGEEAIIVTALKYLGDCNVPLDREDVKKIVQQYVAASGKKTQFANGSPGKDWFIRFERRHPDLARRDPELLTTARENHMIPEIVNPFFDKLEKIVEENNLTAEQIYNCDETGLNTDPRLKKVYVAKGKRDAYLKNATEGKACYSVLVCGSAAGEVMPPFTVFKGKNLYKQWMNGGPKGATYGCSPSGWMTDDNFEAWLKTQFVKVVQNKPKPILLLFDGHNSHLTLGSVQTAIENQIILLCLPPHTSHRLQPCDVNFFVWFKNVWREVLKDWARQTNYENVTKPVFPHLLAKAWAKIPISSPAMIGGFKGSGIWPVDRNRILQRIAQDSIGYID